MQRNSGDEVAIAFDRASVRTFDRDGHLHVELTNISKATVNPYLGREIPDYQDLGLEPERRYNLLRDPGELEKAASTFNGKPLLYEHKPIHAEDHDHDLTVGSVTGAVFEAPYLKANLAVWSGPAIRTIEDGSQKELSSAYRYRADMTPGTFEGVRYDGVMRDIVGNHVALVKEGRAGPDVVVGDSLENITMAKTALTRAGAHTQGALSVYLLPKLAQDAKIDLTPLVTGLTAKNYKARKPAIVADLKKRTQGKLAQDANIDDVVELLDAMEQVLPIEVSEEPAPTAEVAPVADPEEGAKDDASGEVRALLAGKVDDETIDKIVAMLADTPVSALDADKLVDKDKKPAMDAKNYVTRQAMDAAIKVASDAAARAAAKSATDAATRTQREIRDAERAVRPYVGDLAMAHDSAESVYRTALTSLNVNVEGVHPSAFPTILSMQPKAGDAPRRTAAPLAQDAAAAKDYEARFPHANRLKT